MAAHHYRAPQPRALTDDERNVQHEHWLDQRFYCEDCLCRHTQPEYAERWEEDNSECWEQHLRLADAEDRAEARHEEARWS